MTIVSDLELLDWTENEYVDRIKWHKTFYQANGEEVDMEILVYKDNIDDVIFNSWNDQFKVESILSVEELKALLKRVEEIKDVYNKL